MSGLAQLFASTIGRKQLVGLTGIGFALFLLAHALGNTLIFVGPEAYNQYGHALISNPLIYLAEVGLVAILLTHMGLAIVLTLKNKKARPKGYAVSPKNDKATSFVTKTMIHQGALIIIFIVLHLITFKYGEIYDAQYGGEVIRDLHRLVVEVFQSPVYVFWYIFCLLIIGYHLSHGVSSAVQSLGFNHPDYSPKIKVFGYAFSALVTGTFILQPLYVFFVHKG